MPFLALVARPICYVTLALQKTTIYRELTLRIDFEHGYNSVFDLNLNNPSQKSFINDVNIAFRWIPPVNSIWKVARMKRKEATTRPDAM